MKIVVVGGHTRNIGKTAVMCALIREFAPLAWTAVKITQYGHGICSRDGHACGCAPDEHPFALTEEIDSKGRADTCRFLAAGARRSLWLRVRQGQIAGALPLLWRSIGRTEWVIVESNSIMEHINPMLYLFVVDAVQRDFKISARRALARASGFVSIGPAGNRVDGTRWPAFDRSLLDSKPVFIVSKPVFWNSSIAEFVACKLVVPERPPEAVGSGA